MNTAQTPIYDAGGNVIDDGANQYLYDAERRLCAASGVGGMIGYVYDAEGNRIAKRTITSWSCDPTANGFLQTAGYVVGPAGEQLTEIGYGGGWLHTNVWAAGKLIATFDNHGIDNGLHFHLDDPLGTRRAQTDGFGTLEAQYASLPYGDGLETGTGDPTENHFTGKERDDSGNDYFLARYYNSAIGRFLSPDWSAKAEPVPYAKLGDPQSLNLYSYVRNNPMSKVDADGHCFEDACILEVGGGSAALLYGGAALAGAVGLTGVAITLHNNGDAILSGAKSLINDVGSLFSKSESSTSDPATPAPAAPIAAPLPANPDDLKGRGYVETSHPDAADAGHREFTNPSTGDKVRHDRGTPGAPGNEGEDHYHRYNPDSTGKADQYLDQEGKPVPRGSKPSHLKPEADPKPQEQ